MSVDWSAVLLAFVLAFWFVLVGFIVWRLSRDAIFGDFPDSHTGANVTSMVIGFGWPVTLPAMYFLGVFMNLRDVVRSFRRRA